ncbi:MAG: putative NRPS-like protein biosynthetic cluster [Bogoriella megaspora]|nr:MAG: putative NRPS-like protein biosynthetic cluster [Bogoriella megaspora]
MDTNYFVCALGQASQLRRDALKDTDINNFIDQTAVQHSDRPAVGFSPGEVCDEDASVFSFSQVQRLSRNMAYILQRTLKDYPRGKPVGLLSRSSPSFLFTWLALIRLHHPVLLIAPQLSTSAIVHLCRTSEVALVLHDGTRDQTRGNVPEWLRMEKMPGFHQSSTEIKYLHDLLDKSTNPESPKPETLPTATLNPNDTAYLFHTSGTSSGLPKPTPQSHHGAIGVVPRFTAAEDQFFPATFSTTPLYHGGIADLFRSWASGAMIWLFPGHEKPVTAGNIVQCLEFARNCAHSRVGLGVGYFSSVPYVLQMMASTDEGLQNLRAMDIVGVGGAALPPEIGDTLVKEGVNLVSRFGSAECGFLLSSHREYSEDHEWQYLRKSEITGPLHFESQGDGTHELIVGRDWPHMAKRNRPDGSYATSDLFVLHPRIPNAWKYHSRADSQLTLLSGKKFDPAPLEAHIAAASPLVDDVLIFGNGKMCPGVLIFRSEKARDTTDEELIETISPLIEDMNTNSQSHAKIPRSMLVPRPFGENKKLEKSSKGTIMRNRAEGTFSEVIGGSYTSEPSTTMESGQISDDEIAPSILDIVKSVMQTDQDLNNEVDLFSFGIDSVKSMQIRTRIRALLPPKSKDLPLTVVEDYGSVNGLTQVILERRQRTDIASENDHDDEINLMHELVDKHSSFESRGDMMASPDSHIVLLTGATGALGSHILDQCRKLPRVSKVYCLVRGASVEAAEGRVEKALTQRGLRPLSGDDKVVIKPTRLSDHHLGLSNEEYSQLASETTIVLHLAWSVNFRFRLRNFEKDSISSVQNLINFSLHGSRTQPPFFVFCSSVASVINLKRSSPIPEAIVDDPSAASQLGYSRSKWVAEQICQRAHQDTALKGRIAVFRVGQLAGDLRRGIWNANEAWPLMLSAVRTLQKVPRLENEPLNWLPVDIAATALLEGSLEFMGQASEQPTEVRVYHILNEHREPEWVDLIQWLQKQEDVEVVAPGEWVKSLESLQESSAEHPALNLIDHWKQAFNAERPKLENGLPRFVTERSKALVPTLKDVRPVDEQYFTLLWQWIKENVQ